MVKHGVYLSLLVLMPLLLIQVAYPEEVLSVSFTLHRNDSVELDQMRVINGKPTFYFDRGDYMVQVAGADGKTLYFDEDLRVDFLLFTNPPTEVNYSLVSLRIPYDSRMRYFRAYKDMELIFEKKIEVCNGDGVCDEDFESSMSCPGDCPPDGVDGFCVKESDGVCDPDCYEGIDPDCGGGEDAGSQAATSTLPAGGNGDSPMHWLIYVAAFLVLAVAGILFYRRRAKQKIVRHREEFLKWKEEQERIERSTKKR